MSRVRSGLAFSEIFAGRFAAGRQHARESVRLASRQRNLIVTSNALNALGTAAYYSGDFRAAAGIFSRINRRVARHANPDSALVAYNCTNLGDALLMLGRLHGAARELRRAHALSLAMNRRDNLVISYADLGVIATLRGRHAEGLPLLRSCARFAVRHGFHFQESFVRQYLADGLLAAGRSRAARAEMRRALAAARRHGSQMVSAQIETRAGLLAFLTGDAAGALQHAHATLRTPSSGYGLHVRALAQALAAAAAPSARRVPATIRRALRLVRRSGAFEYELWCRILLAGALDRCGEPACARQTARQAARMARRAGMRAMERSALAYGYR
jgi:tetratricopeptide (TPR) repeat protein